MDGTAPLFGPIAGDLERLEGRFPELFASDASAAAVPMKALFAAGGKRLRPALVLLAGRLGRYELERLQPAALAVELLHAATLVHDDVIDRAATRRGRPTVTATEGWEAAIVIGDHAFAKAYRQAGETGDPAVVGELADAVMAICAGELEQQASRWRWEPELDAYLRRIEGKTAVLLAAACRVGGRLAGLSAGHIAALGRYGRSLGLAFQIADDVLDYTGTEAELGKPVGHDLEEGMATLPLMLTPEAVGLLLPGVQPDGETARRVIDLVRGGSGPRLALERASELAEAARSELAPFGDLEAAAALRDLAAYVVSRKL